jgi:phosphatidylinositol glycan class B
VCLSPIYLNYGSRLTLYDSLRISLLLAITACILRPTNILIWLCIVLPTITSNFSASPRFPSSDFLIFLREGVISAVVVLGASALSDYLYYGAWTFPPYQLLSFNIYQGLAVFYGRNDWHYYLSQGLPLLLTTYLPFAVIGMWKPDGRTQIQSLFTVTVLTTLMALSQISHKEVRFIYPLLPILHILAAPAISSCMYLSL